MSFYLLPRAPLYIYKNITYIESDQHPTNCVSQSLSHYLYNIKEKINDNEKQWDIYKKYTNPYEYIHSLVPLKKKAVSKHKPLSRSFFKMIEMIHIFNIYFTEPCISTFHLAEGPGGFIEAIVKLRNCKEDKYIGMTLLDNNNDNNIPAWKKTELFLKNNPNVSLENGMDNTGNILKLENFVHVVNKYSSKMDLITGDGGFDFSLDFNQQEIFIGKLLFAQIAFALCLQKKNGKFILKIFDCFMQHTIDLIYLLSSFYEKVYIMKPYTSRYANSEKYIVCIGFLYSSHHDFYSYLYRCFAKMCEEHCSPLRFLNVPVSHLFVKKVEEYNSIFGQKQIQNIHYTLSLMEQKTKHDKIDFLVKTNIQKSMDWCMKHNIPFFQLNGPSNMFKIGET